MSRVCGVFSGFVALVFLVADHDLRGGDGLCRNSVCFVLRSDGLALEDSSLVCLYDCWAATRDMVRDVQMDLYAISHRQHVDQLIWKMLNQ